MNAELHQAVLAAARANTPIGVAIRAAAEAHPAVQNAPQPLQSSRRAAITATADAMADAGDNRDAEDAGQLVDEAVISLAIQPSRTLPVQLRILVAERHRTIAAHLAQNEDAVTSGFALPESIARIEAAAARLLRMRSASLISDHDADSMIQYIVSGIVEEILRRNLVLTDMEDNALLDIAQTSFDAALPAISGITN